MTQDPPLRVFRLQLTYLAIVALVVLLQTLPLQSLPYPFAPADVPLAITFAWIMRRPDVMSLFSPAQDLSDETLDCGQGGSIFMVSFLGRPDDFSGVEQA